MRSITFAALLGLAALATATEFKEEDDVLVLTDETFDDALKEHDTLLVEFYAPWCGHCKRLTPEYAKAAAELKQRDPPLRIAKVDATEERELSDRFGVRGFPTLKFFRGGKASEYEGGRTASDIVKFVVKKSGPAYQTVATKEEATKFAEANEVAVLGIFSDVDSDEAKAFIETAKGNDDVPFAVSTADEVAETYEVKAPSVVLVKKFDDGRADFDGEFTEAEINTFVAANSMPNVIRFGPETARKIFAPDQPIKHQMLLFADEEADSYKAVRADFEKIAAEYKGKALFVFISAEEDRVLNYFGFDSSDLPTTVIVHMAENGMKKYKFTGDKADEANFRSFVQSYLDGNLKPWLKSEQPPANNDEPVKVIVGTTFEDIVLDDEKDVLVEFYAPWCGHCKSLAPKYEELGEMFEDVKTVTIAKMDATANEIDQPGVNVQGFPTIIFFPAGKKDSPVDYSGARTAEAMADFIKEHATSKFDLEDDTEDANDEEDTKDEL